MFHTGFQLRPGANQVPRQTLRHWPILTAIAAAVAVSVAVFAFTSRPAPRAVPRIAATGRSRLGAYPDAPPPPVALSVSPLRAHVVVAPVTYTVRAGDSLSKIAARVLGKASLWPSLWWVNRSHVHNPAALEAGTVLSVVPHRQSARIVAKAIAAIPKPPPPRPAPAVGTGGSGTVAAAPAAPAPAAPAPAAPAYTGGVLTAAQVGAYWLGAGGPAWAESAAEAVAYCESGYNPAAYNPSGATGLFQILGAVVPGNLTDPAVNAANAVAKFNASGQTWAQWVCQP